VTLQTHLKIDNTLCGEVVALEEGYAEVLLETTACMAADEKGLVHGGFVFGAADYAAMAAVNAPTVVLAACSSRFLAPATVGDAVVFKARCEENDGRKYTITVRGYCGETACYSGTFTAVVTNKHVLD
jgi:acyl-coenzyme A thioesterase PaaI-like protein